MKKYLLTILTALSPVFAFASFEAIGGQDFRKSISMPPVTVIQDAIQDIEATAVYNGENKVCAWSYKSETQFSHDGVKFKVSIVLPNTTEDAPVDYDMSNLVIHPISASTVFERIAGEINGWKHHSLYGPDYLEGVVMSTHNNCIGGLYRFTLGDISKTLMVMIADMKPSVMARYIPVITSDFVGFELNEVHQADVDA